MIEALREGLESKKPWNEISKKLGVCVSSARQKAMDCGFPLPGNQFAINKMRREWKPEADAVLRQAIISGLPWKIITKQLGVNHTAARKRAKELGLPLLGSGNWRSAESRAKIEQRHV